MELRLCQDLHSPITTRQHAVIKQKSPTAGNTGSYFSKGYFSPFAEKRLAILKFVKPQVIFKIGITVNKNKPRGDSL